MLPSIQRQRNQAESIEEMSQTIEDNLIKRLEDIEYFILKKKKNDSKHPTVFDLCNDRITNLDSDLKEQLAQLRVQIDQLNTDQQIVAHRVNKLAET
jgi:hypothetical protein